MSKFRALVASALLATALIGGIATSGGATEAKAPLVNGGPQWCC